MGLLACQDLAPDAAQFAIAEQQYQSRCSWCELVYIMSEILQRIMCGMENRRSDLQDYQVVANKILEVAEQQSQLGLSRTVLRHMQMLEDFLSVNPLTERLTAPRQDVREVHKTSSSSSACTWKQTAWRRGVPQNSKAGSKRGLRETGMFQQYVDDCCALSIPEGSSKRIKHLGHLVCNAEKLGVDDSISSDRNPNPEYLSGEECKKSRFKSSASICFKDKSQYICKDIIEEVIPISSLDSLPANEVCKSLASGILSYLLDVLRNLPGLRWFSKKKRTVSAQRKRVEKPIKTTPVTEWSSLPYDLQENVLLRLGFEDLFRFKILSKTSKKLVESEAFCKSRGATSSSEGLFTAINYYMKNNAWQCTGFDLRSRRWRSLPTFSPTLPAPDADLFKEYSVCGHGSLMCADVAKLPKKGELVVFNPLTRETFALPPLLNPRSPVLVHLWVSSATKSYKVVVAGSSTAMDEHLSKKMEVFDSKTSKWEETVDLPGPAFGLNEHQSGACLDGVLYFISFLEGDCRRAVVAFDMEKKKWLENKACPIPASTYSNTLQLVETNGKVYLFSEQERNGSVEHCIDVLEISNCNVGAMEKWQWRNVVRVKNSGGRGLQVYPEHTCVSFGDGKLCIFNTLKHGGVVYDMRDGKQVEVLQPPPLEQKGDNFFSLNPTLFTLQPSFDSDPIPLIVDPN